MRQMVILKRGFWAAALAVVAGLAAGPAIAQGGINKDADEILRSMSTFLGGTKAFSVAADISNEVITREGEKLQLSSYGTVVFQRPAGFYFHRHGRLGDVEAFFDGKTVSLSGKKRGVYVQKEVAGTTDDALNMITSQIGIDLPGVDLLISDPYAVLSSGVTSSGYHGTAYVQGVECHHLSFREDDVDWQLWVKTGDAGVAHRGERTTDDGLRLADQRQTFENPSPGETAQRQPESERHHTDCRSLHHLFSSPIFNSPVSSTASASSFVAPSGTANVNRSAAITGFRFQLLICTLYCGAPVSHLVVITYFMGSGWSPVFTHSCQSTSSSRKDRW